VVSNPGAQVSEDELGAFCRKELAGYKVPKISMGGGPAHKRQRQAVENKLKEQYVQRQFQQAGISFAKQSSAVPEDD